jgi:hypothetical protein
VTFELPLLFGNNSFEVADLLKLLISPARQPHFVVETLEIPPLALRELSFVNLANCERRTRDYSGIAFKTNHINSIRLLQSQHAVKLSGEKICPTRLRVPEPVLQRVDISPLIGGSEHL